jgi:methylenetetrahydrofolate reductase (NADPH)
VLGSSTTGGEITPRTARRDVAVSFEFFPPGDERMSAQLCASLERLAPLGPRFASVTCGAKRHRTTETVRQIQARTNVATAPHLTCAGAPRSELVAMARHYWAAGVRHVVALRGDAVGASHYEPHADGFPSTVDLVSALKDVGDFDVSVAAYPEKHPDSASQPADIQHLKRKCEAGASRAITQFFFDSSVFLRFRDDCRRAGINAPIVPGILPIGRFAELVRFASRCGATIPAWLAARFEGLDDDPETLRLISAATSIELVEQLRSEGVEEFHFYTLNRAELTYAICHALGLRPSGGAGA